MDFGYEEERILKDSHASVSYLDYNCRNCGRQRVELLQNGKHVCEKCNWNQVSSKYDFEYMQANDMC